MYLTPDEYKGEIPEKSLETALRNACRAVDSLTFNRIVKTGFDNLTDFQKEIVKEAVQLHADFAYNNAELFESPLNPYSISGVSMTFDRSKVVTAGGVTTTS